MRSLVLAALALSLTAACTRRSETSEAPRAEGRSTVVLDGERAVVKWSDGDTFKVVEGPRKGKRARLTGFNTLEDYGPVHRWGEWTHAELFALSHQAGEVAREGAWTCTSAGEEDAYGRLLVSCPDAAEALVRGGLAMAFSVDGPASQRLLEVQRQAQQEGRGMWRKGVPAQVVSSVHSAGEREAYNRVVDTRTGEARKVPHSDRYQSCQEVCVGEGAEASCLVYVPYENRYGAARAPCLKGR